MKKILILLPFTFLERDYERFGIDVLKKNFLVRVLDFSPWLRPNLWKETQDKIFKCEEHLIVSNEDNFLNLDIYSESFIIFDFLGDHPKSGLVRNKLRKKNNIFVGFDINLIPQDKISLIDLIKKLLNLVIKPKKFFSYFIKFYKDKLNKAKNTLSPDIMVIGGLGSAKRVKIKNKIYAHSMDYDIYLKLKNKSENSSPSYAVFLDQDLNTHPDYKILNLDPPASENDYYPLLNNFLKNFKNQTGLDIKFAVHPKSLNKKLPNLLQDVDYSTGNTAELIKNSSVVLLHSTTAVSFAVLFNKPTIVLTSKELSRSWLGPKINRVSKLTSGKLINMNKNFNLKENIKELLKIDEEKYKKYRNDYIKVPNTPDIPLWEIVTNYLKNHSF